MKIKDYYLSLLSENEDFFYADNQSIEKTTDVHIDKAGDTIKIDFDTTYGKPGSLVVKYSKFKDWYKNNIDKHDNAFKAFVEEYLTSAKETEDVVSEVIDDDGNIMSSDDKPNNSTNTMVGSKNNWDLEKLYKTLPKSIRFYGGGGLGMGFVTW
jgi:hypothetical protein